MANRVNPYEPFGILNDESASTVAEYKARQLNRIREAVVNDSRRFPPKFNSSL